MAIQTGSTYVSDSMTDIVKIPTANLRLSTTYSCPGERLCQFCFLCLRQRVMFSGCSWVCLCVPDVLKRTGHIFTKISALVQFGTRINASMFAVKRSKVKVTAWPRAQRAEVYRARRCFFVFELRPRSGQTDRRTGKTRNLMIILRETFIESFS